MKIRFISYGHKYYEEQNIKAPDYDFLFNLRDLKNPFWVPGLKEFNGLDLPIHEYFAKDDQIQDKVKKITVIIEAFIEDFCNNAHRDDDACLTFAFKCTGGKHRSVYFAQKIFENINETKSKFSRSLDCRVEHVDLDKQVNRVVS